LSKKPAEPFEPLARAATADPLPVALRPSGETGAGCARRAAARRTGARSAASRPAGRPGRPLQAKPGPASVRAPRSRPPMPPPLRPPGSAVRATLKRSALSVSTATEEGQIYGIWKNDQYPNKIAASSLTADKCLYVGKTSRGENLGGRFVEHVKNDQWGPWWIGGGADYSNNDDDCWPYVVRNIWAYKSKTKLDVAVAERSYIQFYTRDGAKFLNNANALSLKKFIEHKDSGIFTTMSVYSKDWKPTDFKKL
jgi:hypothetical protein